MCIASLGYVDQRIVGTAVGSHPPEAAMIDSVLKMKKPQAAPPSWSTPESETMSRPRLCSSSRP